MKAQAYHQSCHANLRSSFSALHSPSLAFQVAVFGMGRQAVQQLLDKETCEYGVERQHILAVRSHFGHQMHEADTQQERAAKHRDAAHHAVGNAPSERNRRRPHCHAEYY